MLTLLSLAVASASDWYLETGPRPDRAEVAGWEQREVEGGADAHLVRRFVDGEGWRFVLRTEGFGGEDQAMEGARAMADRLGVAVAVVEVDAGKANRRAEVTPSGRAAPRATAPDPGPDAADVLARAVGAIGDPTALLRAARDGRLLLAYRRTLADGRVIDHTWAAAGDALYLAIEPVRGDVVASRLQVVGDGAWLSVGGGAWTAQNADRTRSAIEAAGPTEVVPLVWLLPAAVESRREFERMQVIGKGTFDGEPTTRLEYGGDAVTTALALDIAADGLPRRVAFGGDATVHEFRGWSRVRGVAVPHEIRTWRNGALTDTVVVETLDAGANLPAEWTRAPR